jgi:hypothetical protein
MPTDPEKDPQAEPVPNSAADPAPETAPEAAVAETSRAEEEAADVLAFEVSPEALAAAAAAEALASLTPPAPLAPTEPVSMAKEWGAAVVLMAILAGICALFLNYLRN